MRLKDLDPAFVIAFPCMSLPIGVTPMGLSEPRRAFGTASIACIHVNPLNRKQRPREVRELHRGVERVRTAAILEGGTGW